MIPYKFVKTTCRSVLRATCNKEWSESLVTAVKVAQSLLIFVVSSVSCRFLIVAVVGVSSRGTMDRCEIGREKRPLCGVFPAVIEVWLRTGRERTTAEFIDYANIPRAYLKGFVFTFNRSELFVCRGSLQKKPQKARLLTADAAIRLGLRQKMILI